jgi:hypothetical protein
MLHDPKWGFGTLEHLRGWLAAKPRDEKYPWADCSRCVVGQYHLDHQQSLPRAYDYYISFGSQNLYTEVCSPEPWTFGDASDRLDKALTIRDRELSYALPETAAA